MESGHRGQASLRKLGGPAAAELLADVLPCKLNGGLAVLRSFHYLPSTLDQLPRPTAAQPQNHGRTSKLAVADGHTNLGGQLKPRALEGSLQQPGGHAC